MEGFVQEHARFGSRATSLGNTGRRFGTNLTNNVIRSPSSSSKQSTYKRVRVRRPNRKSTEVEKSMEMEEEIETKEKNSSSSSSKPKERIVTFLPGPVGLQLEPSDEAGAKVVRFVDGGPNNPGQARRSGAIRPGDLVIRAESAYRIGMTYDEIISILKKSHTVRELRIQSYWDGLVHSEDQRSSEQSLPKSIEMKAKSTTSSSKKTLRTSRSARKRIERTPLAQAEYNMRRDPPTPSYLANMPPTTPKGAREPSRTQSGSTGRSQKSTINANDISHMMGPSSFLLDSLAEMPELEGTPKASPELKNGPIIVRLKTPKPPSPSVESEADSTKSRKSSSTKVQEKKLSTPRSRKTANRSTDSKRVRTRKEEMPSLIDDTPPKSIRATLKAKTPAPPASRFDVDTPYAHEGPRLSQMPDPQTPSETMFGSLQTEMFSPANVKRISSATKGDVAQRRPLARVLDSLYDVFVPRTVAPAPTSPIATKETPYSDVNSPSGDSAVGNNPVNVEASKEVEEMKELKRRVLKELEHAKITLTARGDTRDEVQNTVDELFRENAVLRQNFQKRIQMARAEHEKTEQELKALYSTMLDQRESRIEELSTVNGELKTDLRRAQDRFFNEIGREIAEMQKEYKSNSSSKTQSATQAHVDALEEDLDAKFGITPEKLTIVENRTSDSDRSIEKVNAELSKVQEENDELKMQLEMSRTLVRELEGQILSNQSNGEPILSSGEVVSHRQLVKKRDEELALLRAEMQILKESIESKQRVEDENLELNKQVQDLRQQIDNIAPHAKALDSQRKEFEERKDILIQSHFEAQVSMREIKEELEASQKFIEGQKALIESSKKEKEELREELKQALDSVSKFKKESEMLQSNLSGSKMELRFALEEVDRVNALLVDNLESQKEAAEVLVKREYGAQLEQVKSNSDEDMIQGRSIVFACLKRMSSMEAERETQCTLLDRIQKQNDIHKEELAAQRETIEEQREKIIVFESSLDELKQERKDSQTVLQVKEERIIELSQELVELKESRDQSLRTVESYKHQINEFEHKYEIVRAANSELQASARHMSDKIKELEHARHIIEDEKLKDIHDKELVADECYLIHDLFDTIINVADDVGADDKSQDREKLDIMSSGTKSIPVSLEYPSQLQLGVLQSTCNRWEKLLQTQEKSICNLQNDLDCLRKANIAMEMNRDATSQMSIMLQVKLNGAQQTLIEALEQKQQYEEENKSLLANLDLQREDFSSRLNAERSAFKSRVMAMQTESEKLHEVLDKKNSQLESIDKELVSSVSQFERLEAILRKTSLVLTEQQSQHRLLLDEKTELEEQIQKLCESKEDTEKALLDASERNAYLVRQLSSQDNQIHSMRQEITQKVGELEEQRQRNSKLKIQVQSMSLEKESALSMHEHTEKLLQGLQQTHAELRECARSREQELLSKTSELEISMIESQKRCVHFEMGQKFESSKAIEQAAEVSRLNNLMRETAQVSEIDEKRAFEVELSLEVAKKTLVEQKIIIDRKSEETKSLQLEAEKQRIAALKQRALSEIERRAFELSIRELRTEVSALQRTIKRSQSENEANRVHKENFERSLELVTRLKNDFTHLKETTLRKEQKLASRLQTTEEILLNAQKKCVLIELQKSNADSSIEKLTTEVSNIRDSLERSNNEKEETNSRAIQLESDLEQTKKMMIDQSKSAVLQLSEAQKRCVLVDIEKNALVAELMRMEGVLTSLRSHLHSAKVDIQSNKEYEKKIEDMQQRYVKLEESSSSREQTLKSSVHSTQEELCRARKRCVLVELEKRSIALELQNLKDEVSGLRLQLGKTRIQEHEMKCRIIEREGALVKIEERLLCQVASSQETCFKLRRKCTIFELEKVAALKRVAELNKLASTFERRISELQDANVKSGKQSNENEYLRLCLQRLNDTHADLVEINQQQEDDLRSRLSEVEQENVATNRRALMFEIEKHSLQRVLETVLVQFEKTKSQLQSVENLLPEKVEILEMMNDALLKENTELKEAAAGIEYKLAKDRCLNELVLCHHSLSLSKMEAEIREQGDEIVSLQESTRSVKRAGAEEKKKVKEAIESLADLIKTNALYGIRKRKKSEQRIASLTRDLLHANAKIVSLQKLVPGSSPSIPRNELTCQSKAAHEKLVMRTANLTLSKSKTKVETTELMTMIDSLKAEKQDLEINVEKLKAQISKLNSVSSRDSEQIVFLRDLLIRNNETSQQDFQFDAGLQVAFLRDELQTYKEDLKIILTSLLADLHRQHPNGAAILKTVERLTALACIVDCEVNPPICSGEGIVSLTKESPREVNASNSVLPSTKMAAKSLANHFVQKDKLLKAQALRRWSSFSAASKSRQNQKVTAVALSNQLRSTQKKLGNLKNHLKRGKYGKTSELDRKPRLRSVLMTKTSSKENQVDDKRNK